MSWMSCARSLVLVVRLRCVLQCGIRAIVFDSRYFLILSLVSILTGVISFLCTLGVRTFGIVFSTVAAWIGSVCLRCVGSVEICL